MPISLLFTEIVVVYLDCKDNATTCACYGIGDYHRPDYPAFMHETLQHERECTDGHHKECGQCYAVGVTGTYCGYCLGKITQYHPGACDITEYSIQCILFHNLFIDNNHPGTIGCRGNKKGCVLENTAFVYCFWDFYSFTNLIIAQRSFSA